MSRHNSSTKLTAPSSSKPHTSGACRFFCLQRPGAPWHGGPIRPFGPPEGLKKPCKNEVKAEAKVEKQKEQEKRFLS
jgi:hypothetical protein